MNTTNSKITSINVKTVLLILFFSMVSLIYCNTNVKVHEGKTISISSQIISKSSQKAIFEEFKRFGRE